MCECVWFLLCGICILLCFVLCFGVMYVCFAVRETKKYDYVSVRVISLGPLLL